MARETYHNEDLGISEQTNDPERVGPFPYLANLLFGRHSLQLLGPLPVTRFWEKGDRQDHSSASESALKPEKRFPG
jgi:hypothetical protein